MIWYRINPYISFVESRLFPEAIEYAVFHRLSGELITPSEKVRTFFQRALPGNSSSESTRLDLGELGDEAQPLIQRTFLITDNYDPLAYFADQLVTRPTQNPAIIHRSKPDEWTLIRTSMVQTVYSRKRGELPEIVEEVLSPIAAKIFLLADGTRTLRQVFATIREAGSADFLEDSEFRSAIDFLTTQERQLVKFTSQPHFLNDPYSPVNIIPRNLYHSDRWHDRPQQPDSRESITDFHLAGIDDPGWEFDQIEPTMNHGFRFPHEALGGLAYGSRFCLSTLNSEVFPLLDQLREINVLEVGGGTGSFARAFIEQANKEASHIVQYHILELSPALMESQRKVLDKLLPEQRHFHQDAIRFELPEHKFDLIISNEVIADFPVAAVERSKSSEQKWEGDGASDVEQYGLADAQAPDSFLVNAGVFRFIERAWKHLNPGGTVVVSEYGSEHHYPARSFHLNHDEFTIHFGHLVACATKVGFQCRLLTLKEFLSFDDDILVLNGREEHILCLNHVLKKYGLSLPYAVISKSDLERQIESLPEDVALTGYSFGPIKKGYHFGPNLRDFLVLILNKPR